MLICLKNIGIQCTRNYCVYHMCHRKLKIKIAISFKKFQIKTQLSCSCLIVVIFKGRQSSKGFSGRTSQVRTLPPKTHHFREDGKAKSSSKPQKNNVQDDKLTKSQSIRKDEPPTDASYLTKDQLSRILSSLKSADTEHEPVADLENTYTGQSVCCLCWRCVILRERRGFSLSFPCCIMLCIMVRYTNYRVMCESDQVLHTITLREYNELN